MEKKLAVGIPSTPNFIMVGKQAIPIDDFTNDELREIAKEWTKKLIAIATERRRQKQK